VENGSNKHARWCVNLVETSPSFYRETILTIIAREYGAKRHAAKILARHAQSSYRTAEAWISGRNVPTGHSLLNIMSECEALADAINGIVADRKKQRDENGIFRD
jgi:hypothetical protein